MARKIPEIIWVPNYNPKSESKFHVLMLDGGDEEVGHRRLLTDFLTAEETRKIQARDNLKPVQQIIVSNGPFHQMRSVG